MSNEEVVSKELQRIIKIFDKKVETNTKIKELLRSRKSYEDVNEYAFELGNILSEVLVNQINGESKELITEILTNRLKYVHENISSYAFDVQSKLNKQANIHIKPQKIQLKQDKIDGIVKRLTNGDFDKSKWILGSPIVTYCQSIVDRTVEKNAKLHYDSGMSPKIVRKESGNCCKWCRNLVGVYKYPDVPKDVYRRHGNCGCTVDYIPKDGKTKQNVHTKKVKSNHDDKKQDLSYESVKNEWLKKYKEPNVTDMDFWEIDGVKHFVDGNHVVLDYSEKEHEVAEWLSEKLGVHVKLAPRVNSPEGIKTPDYLINGEKFDLKEITGSGKTTIDNNSKKAKVQAENIIYDVTNSNLSDDEVKQQLDEIYMKNVRGVNIAVIKRGDVLVDIIKRKD